MSCEDILPSLLSEAEIASLVVDETPAIVGYIDCHLVYRFANKAYLDWFGKTREQVIHRPMKEVLGPIYYANLPQTLAALQGKTQTFEREFRLPNGTQRFGLVTYKPHSQDLEILGFYVLVADVSILKKVEFELVEAKEAVEASAVRELVNLRQANITLERLGAIGQEITTHLDVQSTSNALILHTQELLEGCRCTVYVYDAVERKLRSLRDGSYIIPVQHQVPSDCAVTRAFLEGRQVFLDSYIDTTDVTRSPSLDGSTSTLLAGPMITGNNVLGVMTVHASKEQLASERTQLIFRALCVYGAIALDNANAYRALKDTQSRLLVQAKMAALGSMVAGVAHELNTPLGNSLLAISTLEEKSHELQQELIGQTMRRSELDAYLKTSVQTTTLVTRNLMRSAELIRSFKLITGTGSDEQSQTINVCHVLALSIEPFMKTLADLGHSITINVSPDLTIQSYPNTLVDIFKRLLDNVIQHAFAPGVKGEIFLSAQFMSDQVVHLVLKDNGTGIAQENLTHVFEPFFTTKMGHGEGGLGLSICYNLITNILHGDITVQSGLGAGTSFTVSIPLRGSELS